MTQHAAERWAERVAKDPEQPYRYSVQQVLSAVRSGAPIPGRYVVRLSGARKVQWSKAKYIMTMDAVFVLQGNSILTVLPWDSEKFVEVVVHSLFGVWTHDRKEVSRRGE